MQPGLEVCRSRFGMLGLGWVGVFGLFCFLFYFFSLPPREEEEGGGRREGGRGEEIKQINKQTNKTAPRAAAAAALPAGAAPTLAAYF